MTDIEIESFVENSRLVMFTPRNHLQQGVQGDKPLYTEYVKVFEKQLNKEYMESTTVTVKLNEA